MHEWRNKETVKTSVVWKHQKVFKCILTSLTSNHDPSFSLTTVLLLLNGNHIQDSKSGLLYQSFAELLTITHLHYLLQSIQLSDKYPSWPQSNFYEKHKAYVMLDSVTPISHVFLEKLKAGFDAVVEASQLSTDFPPGKLVVFEFMTEGVYGHPFLNIQSQTDIADALLSGQTSAECHCLCHPDTINLILLIFSTYCKTFPTM